jgi:hypothetical protein
MNYPETHPTLPVDEAEPRASIGTTSLTGLLRWLGVLTLLAAAGSYLVSSWMEASPLMRFYVFLGFTAFLAAAGMFCGLRWREDKGARTFLALAALFVPVCAAQIAGFLCVQLGHAAAPHELFTIAPVGESPLLIAGMSFALLALPTIVLAFSALARPEAGRLALSYLVGNLALIQPIRDSGAVLGIAAALLGFLLLMDQRFFARSVRMKHLDGLAMRGAMFLPLLILVGRNLLLFDRTPELLGFSYGAAGALLFLGFPGWLSGEGLRTMTRGCGFVLIAVGWAILAGQWCPGADSVISVGLLPLAGLAMILSPAAGRDAKVYRRMSALTAVPGVLLHLLAFEGNGIVLLSLGLTAAIMAGAFWVCDRLLLVAGGIGFAVTLAHVFFSVREFWAQNLWVSLGALGVVILIASSLIERNWHRLNQGAAALREGWNSWD